MSYRDLEIWKLAREAAIGVHRMTVRGLPKFEMYEEGSQIRRSVKSIRSNIVEGYGRRRYKQEFIRFLVWGSLTNEAVYRELQGQLDLLGRKLNVFIESVEREHRAGISNPASRIPYPAT